MALYFIIDEPIHIHKLSNMLRCGSCINATQTFQANAMSSLQHIKFICVALHRVKALTILYFEKHFPIKFINSNNRMLMF
jgi:late competence protein required for DNA uptake (superfamily II DNA/RNA helicase)